MGETVARSFDGEEGTTGELGEILLELTGRVRRENVRALEGSVLLSSPEESWTLLFSRGRLTVGAGAVSEPDTIVRASTATLIDVHTGRTSGLEAFLAGKVTVRGNLGLALRLESLFEPITPRSPHAPLHRTVRAGRNDVNIVEAGSGEAVILLHGLGATNASFLTTLFDLAPRHRVIAPDLLGHGDTSKPRARYDAATFARFVVELMDALEIDRAHLVGNSLGGRISLEVAMTHSDRVGKVVLLCPAMAFLKRRGFVPFVRALRPELAILPHRLPHRMVVASIRQMFAVPDRLPRAWFEAGADEFLRVFRSPAARYALYAAMRNVYLDEPLGESGFWTRLARLERPTLALWGERDPLVPAAFARHVARVAPQIRSEILEACGHVPQFELPAQTHGHLRAFLEAA
jgi:pimeloyl-ACP methyl ester carboxylesterase/putative sterol carrier protein